MIGELQRKEAVAFLRAWFQEMSPEIPPLCWNTQPYFYLYKIVITQLNRHKHAKFASTSYRFTLKLMKKTYHYLEVLVFLPLKIWGQCLLSCCRIIMLSCIQSMLEITRWWECCLDFPSWTQVIARRYLQRLQRTISTVMVFKLVTAEKQNLGNQDLELLLMISLLFFSLIPQYHSKQQEWALHLS